MVTDTMDHMDTVAAMKVKLPYIRDLDEDSRDKVIDDSWSTKKVEEKDSLESVEKELDKLEE